MNDNGGRRTGLDRRQSTIIISFPDRRSVDERRKLFDRRSGLDRRNQNSFRALFGYERRWAFRKSIGILNQPSYNQF